MPVPISETNNGCVSMNVHYCNMEELHTQVESCSKMVQYFVITLHCWGRTLLPTVGMTLRNTAGWFLIGSIWSRFETCFDIIGKNIITFTLFRSYRTSPVWIQGRNMWVYYRRAKVAQHFCYCTDRQNRSAFFFSLLGIFISTVYQKSDHDSP